MSKLKVFFLTGPAFKKLKQLNEGTPYHIVICRVIRQLLHCDDVCFWHYEFLVSNMDSFPWIIILEGMIEHRIVHPILVHTINKLWSLTLLFSHHVKEKLRKQRLRHWKDNSCNQLRLALQRKRRLFSVKWRCNEYKGRKRFAFRTVWFDALMFIFQLTYQWKGNWLWDRETVAFSLSVEIIWGIWYVFFFFPS